MIAAAVPAAPLMLPGVAPRLPRRLVDPVEAMRSAAREAMAPLAATEAVVVVASGEVGTPRILCAGAASLDGLGASGTTRPVALARLAAGRLGRATGWPVSDTPVESVPADLCSLLLQLDRALPGLPAVPVALPEGAEPPPAPAPVEEIGPVGMLAAGDLSAGLDADSPRPSIEGADAFDAAVVEALRAGDATALGTLGPTEATRVWSRGWSSLTFLLRLVDAPATSVTYRPLRGVGQIVAGWPS